MALPGSYEHSEYVKAALFSAWPKIRAYAAYIEKMRREQVAAHNTQERG